MAQMKSFNPKATGKAMRRLWYISIPTTAALSATLAVAFAIALDGCSSNESNKTMSSSSLNSNGVSKSLPTPTPSVLAKETVTPKRKPVVKRSSTVSYSDSISGVSFRYPRQFTLMTPEKAKLNSALLEKIPMNFVQPGGEKVATIELPDHLATSLLDVNVNKGLTSQQCGQFADPDASDVAGNSPVNTSDESIPSKVNIHGVEFSRVENGTEQIDTRYYHHFEKSNCYEFVLAVAESPDNKTAVDHFELFDKLERIMATVKIKPEPAPPVTANVPSVPSVPNNGSIPQ
jgi:hypothetical protein